MSRYIDRINGAPDQAIVRFFSKKLDESINPNSDKDVEEEDKPKKKGFFKRPGKLLLAGLAAALLGTAGVLGYGTYKLGNDVSNLKSSIHGSYRAIGREGDKNVRSLTEDEIDKLNLPQMSEYEDVTRVRIDGVLVI